MAKKLDIDIEYGAMSGYFGEAVRVMQDVMRTHDYDIRSFKFVLGEEGKFDVRIDGDLVFSGRESGRFPSDYEIESAIKARLAEGAWNDVLRLVRYNGFRLWRTVLAVTRMNRKGVR